MPRARAKKNTKQKIKNYTHADKERVNNPPVGLVTPDTDKDAGKTTYAYDPHLDPQLVWAGKAEHTSFDVPTVSLHVHERIDPRSIIEAVRKRNGADPQLSLFAAPEENPPIREAIEFYKHKHNWTNRLVAGDSLLVMNSLLEKEGLGGQVQMVYIDPPYGIRYGSNFQPFVNKRDVKDGKDDNLTQEPEMICAFRDTWELGIHSYLTYLRDRLLLARELLHESGSCFVQISDENIHHVRELMDEIFDPENFVAQINYRTMTPLSQKGLASVYDYVIWYTKSKPNMKFRPLYVDRQLEDEREFCYLDEGNGSFRKLSSEEVSSLSRDERKRVFKRSVLTSSGYTPSCTYEFQFEGKTYSPLSGKSWRTHPKGMEKLISSHRLFLLGVNPYFRQYHSDFQFIHMENSWHDTAAGFSDPKVYVVQTHEKVIQRCMLMTTDPGDMVFDPTCGAGTTAIVAEHWARRWITCDTSRVSVSLAKQRLMVAMYGYYELAIPDEGVSSGLKYQTVKRVTLSMIANNDTPEEITIYDQPVVSKTKVRVTGPFTVEAVPAPAVKPLDKIEECDGQPADDAVARTGETQRQGDWRDELFKTGIRGKAGQRIEFSRVEPLAGTRWLHADAETKDDTPQRVVTSFGPEHAPIEQRQVALAIEEAQSLVPKPKIIVFAAFQFDPEASKDIDETNWPGVTLLKAQMNSDLLTDDLKKKRASNESFWLIGQPDTEIEKITKGDDKGKYRLSVHGFDYYNTRTGGVESGGDDKIAMWMLDPDYDGRSLFPRQVFFPMAGAKDGWAKLARNLKAEIDEDLIEAYRGTVSLPFDAGEHRRAAVKIIDDRGIESLKLIGLE